MSVTVRDVAYHAVFVDVSLPVCVCAIKSPVITIPPPHLLTNHIYSSPSPFFLFSAPFFHPSVRPFRFLSFFPFRLPPSSPSLLFFSFPLFSTATQRSQPISLLDLTSVLYMFHTYIVLLSLLASTFPLIFLFNLSRTETN